MPNDGQNEGVDEYKLIYDKAVKLLSIRLHTREELSRKLFRYKPKKDVINRVLDRLAELKVLDDERFAEIFLQNLIRYKTFGYYGLKAKLLARGIRDDLIEKLLQENLSLEDEERIARKFIGKKPIEREKLAASLSRKGFRSQVIAEVLKSDQFMV